MKVRKGFVSNSSSSSFIVALPEVPKSAKHLQKMLFHPHQEKFGGLYQELWPIEEAMRAIWNEFKGKKPNDTKVILESMHGSHQLEPSYDQFRLQNGDLDFKAMDIARKKFSKNLLKLFLDSNPNTFVYAVEFADGDGALHSALEHGDTFANVPHIKFSNH